MALSVSRLPVELIHAIALSYDTKVRRSASYIVWLGSTSHHLHSALRESHIWRVLYNEQYMHANPESEVARRALRREDYLLLFQDRRRLDKELLSALDHLIDTGEREPLCRFIAKHRHDVQDVLEYISHPISFGDPSLSRFIARKRWSAHSRVLLERLSAVDTFISLKNDPDAVSFEDGLMALSQFEGISAKDLREAVSLLHQTCEADLLLRLQWEPGTPPSADLALAICALMRREGFLPATPERYHDMGNHYPHKFLTTNRQNLPMSLVWTFVCLATRFGFEARPVSYPGTVLAAIKLPESKEWLYINLFREELTTQTEAEISVSLQPGFPRDLVQPATTRLIITRAMNNVFVSTTREFEWLALYLVTVFFASQGTRDNTTLWSYILRTANERAPFDLVPIIYDRLLGPDGTSSRPEDANIAREAANLKCGEDESPPRVVRAHEGGSGDEERTLAVGMMIGAAQFIIGFTERERLVTILDHRHEGQHIQEYPYMLVADQWRASALQDGSTQSDEDLFEIGMAAVSLLGHHTRLFQGLEIENGKVRLLLSTRGKQQYPDDDRIAQQWMEEGSTRRKTRGGSPGSSSFRRLPTPVIRGY